MIPVKHATIYSQPKANPEAIPVEVPPRKPSPEPLTETNNPLKYRIV